MLAFADNGAFARRAARDDARDERKARIRQGYEKAMNKYPQIIANLAE
jgi:hypothetical protein